MKAFVAVAVAALAVLGARADDCERSCTDVYEPVCANNGRTYINSCTAEVAACRLGIPLTVTAIGECAPKQCDDACGKVNRPVCGTDGVTYSNECELTRRACNSFVPVTVLHDGPCALTDCPEMCTEQYAPVCTKGGLTFENLCQLFSARCRAKGFTDGAFDVAHIGRCQPEDCPDACTTVNEPVCGSNGVTYGNECVLRRRNCRRAEAVLAVSAGACVVPTDCATATCPANTQCVPMERECFTEPCPQFECVPMDEVPPAEDCDIMCPMTFAPVCGSDLTTYSNPCELGAAACRNRANGLTAITVLHQGECTDTDRANCDVMCTMEYAPVCGSDVNTYSNPCELEAAACRNRAAGLAGITVLHSGECTDADQQANCDTMCTMEYAPICGSDLSTYSNQCELDAAACRSTAAGLGAITVLHTGECTDEDMESDEEPLWRSPSVAVPVALLVTLVVLSGVVLLVTLCRRRRMTKNGMIMLVNMDESPSTPTTSGMIATGSTSLRDAK